MKLHRHLFATTAGGPALLASILCLTVLSFVMPVFAAEGSAPSGWSVQVEPVQAEEGQLPPDFSMAIYEDVLVRLTNSGKFQQVYRSGDKQAKDVANLLVLRMTLLKFERGNQTERAVTTVKGATKIHVLVKLLPGEGNAVFERDVEGKVRFFGENLKATDALAKKISATLQQASLPAPGATKGAGQ